MKTLITHAPSRPQHRDLIGEHSGSISRTFLALRARTSRRRYRRSLREDLTRSAACPTLPAASVTCGLLKIRSRKSLARILLRWVDGSRPTARTIMTRFGLRLAAVSAII